MPTTVAPALLRATHFCGNAIVAGGRVGRAERGTGGGNALPNSIHEPLNRRRAASGRVNGGCERQRVARGHEAPGGGHAGDLINGDGHGDDTIAAGGGDFNHGNEGRWPPGHHLGVGLAGGWPAVARPPFPPDQIEGIHRSHAGGEGDGVTLGDMVRGG